MQKYKGYVRASNKSVVFDQSEVMDSNIRHKRATPTSVNKIFKGLLY